MSRKNAYLSIAFLLAVVAAGFAARTTGFVLQGHWQGLFFLRGESGRRWEVKDDLFLGDGSRLIGGISFEPIRRFFRSSPGHRPGEAYLEFEWDEEDGCGWVKNVFSDRTELHTFFSRAISDDGSIKHGLFVGGGLPDSVDGEDPERFNDTGISFSDGSHWWHLWCTANEAISSAGGSREAIQPSGWRFLGSRILHHSSSRLVLASSHEVILDGVPLRIDRAASFTAGDLYFGLAIQVTNAGNRPVRFYYVYGDDPWVGEYGSASENLGWVRDHVVPFESTVDVGSYSFAGMVDIDSGTADFVEWVGPNKPSLVYFSNANATLRTANPPLPLTSDERFIGLQWGPHTLLPQQQEKIMLAIGMARINPRTGLPVKPDVRPDHLPR